jgi:hypothetical protein
MNPPQQQGSEVVPVSGLTVVPVSGLAVVDRL